MVSAKSIRERQRYAEDPESREKRSARDRRYLAAHKDEINQRRRTDPEYRARRNCRRYGLRPEDYRELLARQGGVCAICKKQRPLGIDHCHSTRQVRGLLCSKCNVGLGHYDDDPSLLLAAAAYLEASRLGSAELAGGTATATEIAEKLRRQLELALSAAISLRRCQPDDQGTPDGSRLGTRLRRPYRRFKTRTKRRVKEARKRAGGASKARAKTLVARRTRA